VAPAAAGAGLLTVAVAATIWGAGVATNTPPPATATFGTATASISLPGTEPHLAAMVAQIQRHYGPTGVIENQALSTGSTQSVELRAQDRRAGSAARCSPWTPGTTRPDPGRSRWPARSRPCTP
jgi:hypothetical protein